MTENFHLTFLISIFSLLSLTTSLLENGDETVMFSFKKSLNIDDSLWKGPDPCNWTGVSCNNDNPKRVGAIQIGKKNLIGMLPATLGQLTELSRLELNENNMTGPIPSLAGLNSLQYLYLGRNGFTSVPSDFFDGMSSLQEVNMDYLSTLSPWTVPDRIKMATRLEKFSAVQANIVGVIPSFFGDGFFSLIELHLSLNSLVGGLPGSFSGSPIKSLWLNGQNDKLNGIIDFLEKMTSLTEVWLHMNSFSGPLPDFTGLTELRNFSARDNKLTGPVPLSLINLPSLFSVKMTNNHLQGSTPMFNSSTVNVDMVNKTNCFCLDAPGAACDSRVDLLLSTLGSLGYPYDIAESWKGNSPCNSSWLGISCSRDNITVVNLANKGLVGMISPNFSAITSLERLILANNNLVGTIPIELTKLPNLKQLDVSNNNLHGKVPSFRDGVVVTTNGNPFIGKDIPSPGGARDKKKAIIGSVCGALGFILIIFLTWCYIRRRKQKSSSTVQRPYTMVVHPGYSGDQNAVKITIAGPNTSGGGSETTPNHASSGPNDFHIVKSGNMVITIQVLRDVTNNFSQDNVLGSGGFGTVYKGEFPDGALTAVKRMERGLAGEKGLNEFKSEIAVLTKVRHRHLVSLQGYCLDENEKLLVYEFMPQGTLSSHLFHWKREGLKPLEWMQRLTIALDVARGVEYLHGLALQCFIHRDLKPSNILLGDDMRAKVADFGLVRLAPEGNASFATCLAGTFGYLAPEYAVTGRVTTKVDVYSFGIILMELITGKKALDQTQSGESVQLVSWFRRMSIKQETLREAIDPVIDLDEETIASIGTITELAGHCSAREPSQRPDMSHVVNVLSSLAELWKPSEPDSEDLYGIHPDMTLPQALKKWQALEGNGNSNIDASSSYSFVASSDNTQTRIPLRPPAFADSFTSVDGR